MISSTRRETSHPTCVSSCLGSTGHFAEIIADFERVLKGLPSAPEKIQLTTNLAINGVRGLDHIRRSPLDSEV